MNALKGSFISLGGLVFQQLLTTVGLIVLARLISTEEHGIYSLCFAVFLFFQPFIDFGLTPVYLSLRKTNAHINSTFFIVNCSLGIAIAVLMIGTSLFLPQLYNLPALRSLLLWQACVPIVLAISNQPFAQLQRQKQFVKTEIISTLAQIAAVGGGILLALNGWGAGALVAKHFLYGVTRMLGSVLCLSTRYQWPGIEAFYRYKSHFKQSTHLVSAQLLSGFSGSIEKLIIGKHYGEILLGHYDKANLIVEKPNVFRVGLTSTAMPYLGQMNTGRRAASYKILIYATMIMVVLPILVFIPYGQPLTLLVLGPQWAIAGEYVQWMSLLGISLTFKGLINTILINEGKSPLITKLYLAQIAITYPLVIILLLTQSPLLAVVKVISVSSFIFWFWALYSSLSGITSSQIARRVLVFCSSLVVIFGGTLWLSTVLLHPILNDTWLTLALTLPLCLLISMGSLWIVFTSELLLVYHFIRDRITSR